MGMTQMQLNQPRQAIGEAPVRRQRFPKGLLEEEGKFIDPQREALLLMPEKEAASAAIMLEAASEQRQAEASGQRSGLAGALYERIAAVLAWLSRLLDRSKRRAKVRLTKRGQQALEQLRYLSALCDATSCRTPEETIAAEAAFGEAYYEIMNLSASLERMRKSEEHHHIRRYARHMGRILGAAE
ncbi:MAG: hypothetical protein N3E51_04640 [Candidatus Micrarchaeota archaeon]|nr:hypothetical protein [Candidatus Micrarchaeota archaeon]